MIVFGESTAPGGNSRGCHPGPTPGRLSEAAWFPLAPAGRPIVSPGRKPRGVEAATDSVTIPLQPQRGDLLLARGGNPGSR